jgi:hypothetical protein
MTKQKSKIGRDRVRGNETIATLLQLYSTGFTGFAGWTGLGFISKGRGRIENGGPKYDCSRFLRFLRMSYEKW